MNKIIKYMILIINIASLLYCNSVFTYAETTLPEGTIAGLPEELSVLDEDGQSVNSNTGEYFFEVQDMVAGETYSKNVQIMNLREDKAYHIYFYAEAIEDSGDIDLKNECEAVISLDGNDIYTGLVTGQGDTDISETPIDLGVYTPGQSRQLTCSVTWNDGGDGGLIDYGHKLVASNGTTVLREKSGKESISGEVTFKWTFYAVVDDTYVPPKTGITSFNHMAEIIILALMFILLIAITFVVVSHKKNHKFKS